MSERSMKDDVFQFLERRRGMWTTNKDIRDELTLYYPKLQMRTVAGTLTTLVNRGLVERSPTKIKTGDRSWSWGFRVIMADNRKLLLIYRHAKALPMPKLNRKPERILYHPTARMTVSGLFPGVPRFEVEDLKDNEYYDAKGFQVVSL
jgi:hypothetical protein